jgi:hypothetical protein
MPAQSEKDAVKKVDKHVSPKECFIWHMSTAKGYEPIPGTGCAHWVAHEKGWKGGKEGSNGCNEKYLIRVKDLAAKSGKQVEVADVAVGNVWVSDKQDHCGIVSKVTVAKPGDKDSNPRIEICHCSSAQGKVATNEWATYFKGGGKFYEG